MSRVLILASLFCCAFTVGCASNKAADTSGGGATVAAHCGCGDSCNCKYEETKGAEPCACPAPAAPAADASADPAPAAPATP